MSQAVVQWLINQWPLATVLGLFLWGFMSGRIHSDPEFQQVRKDLETERAAHETTRTALAIASARADAGVRAAEVIASAVERPRHVP